MPFLVTFLGVKFNDLRGRAAHGGDTGGGGVCGVEVRRRERRRLVESRVFRVLGVFGKM